MNFKSIYCIILSLGLALFCNSTSAQFFPTGGFQGGSNGSGGHGTPVGIYDKGDLGDVFKLKSFPNPFMSSTTVRFQLAEPASVALLVYDIDNRKVHTLASTSHFEKGIHTITWDGRNENGKKLSGGIYYYRLIAGESRIIKKIIIL